MRDLTQVAYKRLREAIRDGTLAPGTRITEAGLSSQLDMSRTPIRGAIYMLEAEGLLTNEPRKGLTVTQPDHQMIMELYTMREVLEGTAARLAAQHASDGEVDALSELVAKEGEIVEAGESSSAINVKIHRLIYLAAHNRHLMRTLDSLTSLSLLPTTLGDPIRAQTAHQQHLEILDAIRAHDRDRAEALARAHISDARKHRLMHSILDEEVDAHDSSGQD